MWGASVEAAIRNTLAAAYRWGAANVNSCCAVPTCAARTGGLPYAAEAAGRPFTERALPDVSGAALLLMVGAPYAYAAAFPAGTRPAAFPAAGTDAVRTRSGYLFDFKRSSKRKYRLIYGRAARAAFKQNS